MNNIEKLYEVMGMFATQSSPGMNASPGPNNSPGSASRTISVSHCANLKHWQQDIQNQLRTGRDVYAIVSPGGGKTLPMLCYWVQELLGINVLRQIDERTLMQHLNMFLSDTPNVPKLLYLVPTRQLAQQTIKELESYLISIFTQLINWYLETHNPQDNMRNQHFNRTFIPWVRRYSNLRGDEFNIFWNDFRDRNNPQNIQGQNEKQLQYLIRNIEQAAANYINNVFLYIHTGGQQSRGNPLNAPVIVTIYQSAGNNASLRRAISVVRLAICDEAHLTQPLNSSTEDPKDAIDKAAALYKVLDNMNDRSQLVMLSGTQNPASANQFVDFLNRKFHRNFRVGSVQTTGDRNAAEIEIIENDSLNNTKGLVDSVVNNIQNNKWGNLYVLFSIKRLTNIAEQSMKRLAPKNLETVDQQTKYDSQFQSYLDRPSNPTSVNSSRVSSDSISSQKVRNSQQNHARNIQDPFLRKCVSHGIGIIARNLPGENDVKYETPENDKEIISKLFKDGKIKVLLATSAVGIGVNIDVKRLYIPNLDIFSNMTKKNEEITLRDLSQILNRAGRTATPIATIHTSSNNIDRVGLALNSDPDNFEVSGILKSLPWWSRVKNALRSEMIFILHYWLSLVEPIYRNNVNRMRDQLLLCLQELRRRYL